MSVTLKKDGFYLKEDRRNDQKEWYVFEKKIDRDDEFEFLRAWDRSFSIEEDVLMEDFFLILKKMDCVLLMFIEELTDSQIKKNLEEAFTDPARQKEDVQLTAVEVYKHFEINNYERYDEENGVSQIDVTVGCGGRGPWDKETLECMSEKLSEKELKEGQIYAIEFTPWNELRHLPLRLSKYGTLGEIVWVKGERRKMISNGGEDEWNYSDREIDREKTIWRREVDVTVTLGEFFQGITNELCFFSSPDVRQKQKEELLGRFKEAKEAIEEEKKNTPVV